MGNKLFNRIITGIAATAAVSAALISANAAADWKHVGYMGDLNGDREITIADAVLLTKCLLGELKLTADNGYDYTGRYIGINGEDGYLSRGLLQTADVNRDGTVNTYDLIMLRQNIVKNNSHAVWLWEDEPVTTAAAAGATGTQTTVTTTAAKFIEPSVRDLYGSMPTQGDGKMLVFYVDFPDCRYEYMPPVSDIEAAVFGSTDSGDWNYPFESIRAFYRRASKGSLDISGNVYTYTTKNPKSYYEGDIWHINLVNEIISEMDVKVDFSAFDGDRDKTVDSILISVPEKAGDDDWWPVAGIFGGNRENRADGMDIGHVIVGNAEIVGSEDNKNFSSSYCHELGHCMGMNDIYSMSYGEDYQGMHGSAGFEMMDDAICDFGAGSKLLMGWYTPEQVNIYDKKYGSVTYTLENAQTDKGNCIVIPCGDLRSNYRSEFFIIEYATMSGNNAMLSDEWWRKTGSGIRIYHMEATEDGDPWYNSWKYSARNETETNYGNGRRFMRLVGEGNDYTDNFFRTGDVIDSNTAGFNMYDQYGKMTLDTGVTVTVGEKVGDSYRITISSK